MAKHFSSVQWLPYSVETVFAFFADPANLPRLMPDWQKARIETATYIAPQPPPTDFPGSDRITAGNGTRLTLTIRPIPFSPIRLPWDALIEDFRWLEGFCDIQLRGPFKSWRHCHSVRTERNGTLLRDEVNYELPFGPLGTLVNTLFIRNQLNATFNFRHKRTLELLAKQNGPQ
jgi:ligand-binding SRPBCC domain-containing protein